jgi:lysyl-tRNA synthetase class 1
MYGKPNQPKKMALSLIPKYVDEYIERLRSYKGEADSPITIINYKAIQEKTLETPLANIDYSLICNLVNTFNAQDPNIVMEYLLRYDPHVVDNQKHFETLVKKAILYNEEVLKYRKKVVEFDHTFDKYLHIFNNGLKALQKTGNVTPDVVQILSFKVAKNNNLTMKDWFKFLYQVLLSQESGPKIGSFICLYGIESTIKKIELYLKGSE